MKKLLSVIIALIGLSLVAIDADARRLGGGTARPPDWNKGFAQSVCRMR